MRKINYNGDFKLGIALKGEGIIGVPFRLTFYCGSDRTNTFVVSFDGAKTSENLLILNDGKFIVVLFNEHGLKSGRLKVFKEFFFPDNMMPDGEYHYASRENVKDFGSDEEGEEVKLGDKETDEKPIMIMSEIIYNVLRGKSAYEEWLDAGNEGSREDFFKAMADLYFKETGGKQPVKTEVVEELPSAESASPSTIYLVKSEGDERNAYKEYMVVDGEWEQLGAPNKDVVDSILEGENTSATDDEIDELFEEGGEYGEGVPIEDDEIDALFP